MIKSTLGRVTAATKALRSTVGSFGWRFGGVGGVVKDWFGGSWQQNQEIKMHAAECYHAVFACMTLIAGDISKLPILVQKNVGNGVWETEEDGQLLDLIRKPNEYQNRNQFIENWMLSKLFHGNTFVLKVRDEQGKVVQWKILDPQYVQVLVSDGGSVYYQLATDQLAGVSNENVTVPASEVIHDRFNCLYHPLVGISPLYAAALAANQGLAMQKNSFKLFSKGGQAPGIITAPSQIGKDEAARLKAHWEANYGDSDNIGKVAVLGSGLEFKPASLTSVESQMIEQMKWTAEVVCGTFHVPPYMIGVGSLPNASNIQGLILQYYSQCLQVLIESLETCLDEGAEVDPDEGFEVDIEALLRMDGTAMANYLTSLQKGSIITINEARKKLGLKPIEGGNSIYMQQQNYSLEALVKRDATDDPFGGSSASTSEVETENTDEEDADNLSAAAKFVSMKIKQIGGH